MRVLAIDPAIRNTGYAVLEGVDRESPDSSAHEQRKENLNHEFQATPIR